MKTLGAILLFLLVLAAPAHAQQGFNSGGLNTCSVILNQQLLPTSTCYGYINNVPEFFTQQPTGGTRVLGFDNFIGPVGHTPLPLSINLNGSVSSPRLVLGPGAAGYAPLTISPGVAPTSPANGAMWTDGSGGFFVQSGGITVGPLGAGGSNVNWPATTDIVVSTSSDTPTGIAPVNGECIVASGGAWGSGTCGGLASITMTDSNGNSISSASTLDFGPGVLLSGSSPIGIANLNQPDRLVTTCTGTPSPCRITALDMNGQVNFNGSSLTVTIPAFTSVTPTASASGTALTVSSGTGVEIGALVSDSGVHFPPGTIIISGSGTAWVLNKNVGTVSSETILVSFGGSGQSFVVTNYNATGLVIASTPAINIYPGGATGTIPSQGGMACVSNGSTLDCPGLAVQPNQTFSNQDQTWTGKQTWGPALRPPNVQSGTTYTASSTDCGGTIQTTNGSAVTVTLPGSLTGFAGNGVGCTIIVDQEGAGQVTVVSDGSSTLTTAINGGTAVHTRTQHSLIFEQATVSTLGALNWNLGGDAT